MILRELYEVVAKDVVQKFNLDIRNCSEKYGDEKALYGKPLLSDTIYFPIKSDHDKNVFELFSGFEVIRCYPSEDFDGGLNSMEVILLVPKLLTEFIDLYNEPFLPQKEENL